MSATAFQKMRREQEAARKAAEASAAQPVLTQERTEAMEDVQPKRGPGRPPKVREDNGSDAGN